MLSPSEGSRSPSDLSLITWREREEGQEKDGVGIIVRYKERMADRQARCKARHREREREREGEREYVGEGERE